MTRRHPPARRCRTPLPTSPLKGGRREGGGGSPPGPASGANARPPGCAPPPWKGGEERAAAARAPARRQCCRRAVAKFPNAIAPGEVGRGVDPGARRPGLSGCAGVPPARRAEGPHPYPRSRPYRWGSFAFCAMPARHRRTQEHAAFHRRTLTDKQAHVREGPPSQPPPWKGGGVRASDTSPTSPSPCRRAGPPSSLLPPSGGRPGGGPLRRRRVSPYWLGPSPRCARPRAAPAVRGSRPPAAGRAGP